MTAKKTIEGSKILALITARGGSKGIPNKNIINLEGKPLIGYTIEAAQKSSYISRIVVTTDDPKIAKESQLLGADVPFLRPAEFALDTSPSEDAILHAINWLEDSENCFYDTFVLLQPTSPLRTVYHIDEAIEEYYKSLDAVSLISVTPVKQHPAWMKVLSEDGSLKNYLGDQKRNTRRQDLPELYFPNGAIYLSDVSAFKETHSFVAGKTIPYFMDEVESLDIDTRSDLTIVSAIMREGRNA